VPGERTRLAVLDEQQRPVPVELYLVLPVVASRRLLDEGGLHRLDK
jgi:hypothetical protein